MIDYSAGKETFFMFANRFSICMMLSNSIDRDLLWEIENMILKIDLLSMVVE